MGGGCSLVVSSLSPLPGFLSLRLVRIYFIIVLYPGDYKTCELDGGHQKWVFVTHSSLGVHGF